MHTFRICILGSMAVGKTSVCTRWLESHYLQEHIPTVEDMWSPREYQVEGVRMKIEVLDTAGSEEYTMQQDQWISESDAFILCYDVTQMESLKSIPRFIKWMESQGRSQAKQGILQINSRYQYSRRVQRKT